MKNVNQERLIQVLKNQKDQGNRPRALSLLPCKISKQGGGERRLENGTKNSKIKRGKGGGQVGEEWKWPNVEFQPLDVIPS